MTKEQLPSIQLEAQTKDDQAVLNFLFSGHNLTPKVFTVGKLKNGMPHKVLMEVEKK